MKYSLAVLLAFVASLPDPSPRASLLCGGVRRQQGDTRDRDIDEGRVDQPAHLFLPRREGRDGSPVKWTCESGSPGALSRRGFKRGDLKLGDTIVVDGYRAKNGANMMDARRVTLADGRIVSGASAGDGGPQ